MLRGTAVRVLLAAVCVLQVFGSDAMGIDAVIQQFRDGLIERWQQKDRARISLGYELNEEKWLAFTLPPLTDEIKVITNANIPRKVSPAYDEKLSYELEFQIMDRDGGIIKSGRYYHHTKITPHVDPQTGKTVTAAYYFKEDWIPADGRLIRINLEGMPEMEKSVRIRFRLQEHDHRIVHTLLRLYVPEKMSQRKRRHAWQRMGRRKKEYLSRYNIYPPDFISTDEKANLLRNIWQPLAPLGSEGQDYTLHRLYVLKDVEDSPIDDQELQTGLPIDAHSRVTLPVPEKGATLEFRFSDLQGENAPPADDIELIWFGKQQLKKRHQIAMHDSATNYQAHFEGGLIEICAQTPLSVKVFLIEGKEEIDITPDPMRVRTFTVTPQQALTYPIAHIGKSPTPLRVACRKRFVTAGATMEQVAYALLDCRQVVIRKGHLKWEGVASRYDYPVNDPVFDYITDPAIFYFELPPETAFIRFSSDEEILLTAYSRPPLMYKDIRVPEDYYRSSWQSDEKDVTWFPFMPQDYRRRLKKQQSVIVAVQFRPPEEKPAIAAGRFRWESFQPSGMTEGHYLLTPWQPGTYERQAALQSIYRRLPLREPVSIELDSGRLLAVVRPELFFHRLQRSRPFQLQIDVDGQTHVTRHLTGRIGRIELPPLAVGAHTLTVGTDEPVHVFMNARRSGREGYLLRFASRLTSRGLQFAYTKQAPEDETLSMMVAFQAAGKQRFAFTVELSGSRLRDGGPFEQRSIVKRRYSLRADRNGPVYVLNTSEPTLQTWQTCFFPLHADISPGNYRVNIKAEEGFEGYLLFYRVTPGAHAEYRLLREADGLTQRD